MKAHGTARFLNLGKVCVFPGNRWLCGEFWEMTPGSGRLVGTCIETPRGDAQLPNTNCKAYGVLQ